jgi:hypothetical protein
MNCRSVTPLRSHTPRTTSGSAQPDAAAAAAWPRAPPERHGGGLGGSAARRRRSSRRAERREGAAEDGRGVVAEAPRRARVVHLGAGVALLQALRAREGRQRVAVPLRLVLGEVAVHLVEARQEVLVGERLHGLHAAPRGEVPHAQARVPPEAGLRARASRRPAPAAPAPRPASRCRSGRRAARQRRPRGRAPRSTPRRAAGHRRHRRHHQQATTTATARQRATSRVHARYR